MNEELEPVRRALVLVFSRWLQADPPYYKDIDFKKLIEIQQGVNGMMPELVDEAICEVFMIQPKPQPETPVQP